VLSGGTYSVLGTHSYTNDAIRNVSVTVTEDGISVTASHAAAIAESPGPVSGNLNSTIFETLENSFNAQPSASQVQGVAGALLGLDGAFIQWMTKGAKVNKLEAAALAFYLGEAELGLMAGVEGSNGMDLISFVGDIINALLLQALTEPLGLK
jgi:hypothetical protein